MNKEVSIGDPKSALLSLADDCLKSKKSVDAAAEAFLKEVKTQPNLYVALVGPYEMEAAKTVLNERIRKERSKVWSSHSEKVDPSTSKDRVEALVRSNAGALMDFRLPGGLPLSDATSKDLREAADFYLTQAKDMNWKGKWLSQLAINLGGSKRVSEKYSEADLADIKAKVAE